MTAKATVPRTTRNIKLFIDGEFVDSSTGETYDRFSPGTNFVTARVAAAGEHDVVRAVASARKAFDESSWATQAASARARILIDSARIMREQSDDIAPLIALEAGKPLRYAHGEVIGAADLLEYYGGLARTIEGRTVDHVVDGVFGLTLRQPVGVCASIVPWNFPLIISVQKIAPALACGCTMVLKPSPSTPSSGLALARVLADAGLPAGVLNVLTENDPGAVVGPALSVAPGVDMVSFTGSSATGKRVLSAAAASMKRVSLEAGGKSPNIVHRDADLAAAAKGSAFGIFFNTGQVCIAGSRLLVHEDVADDFLERLRVEAATFKVGDPFEPTTDLGPLVNDAQEARVREFLKDAAEHGRFILGSPEPDPGPYIPPTIVAELDEQARMRSEEVFGPVLGVFRYQSLDEAIRLANQTDYGLAAGVWTSSLSVAQQVMRQVRAGTVWVNTYLTTFAELPHGGFKQSGLGRELGPEALDHYLESKTVQIRDLGIG